MPWRDQVTPGSPETERTAALSSRRRAAVVVSKATITTIESLPTSRSARWRRSVRVVPVLDHAHVLNDDQTGADHLFQNRQQFRDLFVLIDHLDPFGHIVRQAQQMGAMDQRVL